MGKMQLPKEMWVGLVLTLCYLNMTSGLPPGGGSNLAAKAEASKPEFVVPQTAGGGSKETTVEESVASTKTTTVSVTTGMSNSDQGGLTSDVRTSSPAPVSDDKNQPTSQHQFYNEPKALTAFATNQSKVRLRGACNASSECIGEYTVCKFKVCNCMHGFAPRMDNPDVCSHSSHEHIPLPSTDPTMIGVVIGLCFMSVTLCVVLRLFAKARFRENRTIFNTPNPRLMNASLLKGPKSLIRGNSATRSRRGSTASARSGFDPVSPTSPDHHHHQGGNGSTVSAAPLASSSSTRGAAGAGRAQRQISTDTSDSTPTSGRATNKYRERVKHQDSVASVV